MPAPTPPTPIPATIQCSVDFMTSNIARPAAAGAPAVPAAQQVQVRTVNTVAPPGTPLAIPNGTTFTLRLPYAPPSASDPGNAIPAGMVVTIVGQCYVSTTDTAPTLNPDGTLSWPD